MKLLRINHLGIASPTLDEATARMGKLFGMECEHVEDVASQKVKTGFFSVGVSNLEYLEATDPASPIAKFLEKKGPGIHHVAFEVDDVDAAVQELLAKGVRMIDQEPRAGAHGARIAFIHPAETGGVLMELCQSGH
jgi:methylmalonyl-CoA/ethylmalonyl-CoA epimerase